MAWTRRSQFIGAHFWFLREGAAFTSPGAGTVSSTAKPDGNEATWATNKLGICESFEIDPGLASGEIIRSPAPGRLVASDEIVPYQDLKLRFTMSDVAIQAVQLALGTAALTEASNQFNPQGGNPVVKGWLKMQSYRHDNTALLNLDVWVSLRLKDALKGDPKSLTKAGFEALVLYSDLNIGAPLNA